MGRKKQGIRLFVDDVRPCKRSSGWRVSRTVSGAIRILSTVPVSEVSLDHDIICQMEDLHGPHMEHVKDYPEQFNIDFSHLSEETFEPVARYIAVMPENLRPHTVNIHTANFRAGFKLMDILEGKVKHLKRDPRIIAKVAA